MVTATEKRLQRQLETLPPESLRYQVLAAVRRFRASWVELAKLLHQVAYDNAYRQWGYEEFDLYCGQELGLKRPTVKKLLLSYNYLQQHEPERLSAHEQRGSAEAYIPDYQTVALLQRAYENRDLDEKIRRDFHSRAFSEESDEGALRKEIRANLKEAEISSRSAEEARRLALRQLLSAARMLRRRLSACRFVPADLRERCEQALTELEDLA
ncbi:MAG: hypothetical protein N3A66_02925 [Planctomycetota bacterium]|nr:hypothetical protein [Planctomycetota bacterium]